MSDYTDYRTTQPGTSVDYPKQSTPMDPADHPAANVPNATNHYWGNEAESTVPDSSINRTNKGDKQ